MSTVTPGTMGHYSMHHMHGPASVVTIEVPDTPRSYKGLPATSLSEAFSSFASLLPPRWRAAVAELGHLAAADSINLLTDLQPRPNGRHPAKLQVVYSDADYDRVKERVGLVSHLLQRAELPAFRPSCDLVVDPRGVTPYTVGRLLAASEYGGMACKITSVKETRTLTPLARKVIELLFERGAITEVNYGANAVWRHAPCFTIAPGMQPVEVLHSAFMDVMGIGAHQATPTPSTP